VLLLPPPIDPVPLVPPPIDPLLPVPLLPPSVLPPVPEVVPVVPAALPPVPSVLPPVPEVVPAVPVVLLVPRVEPPVPAPTPALLPLPLQLPLDWACARAAVAVRRPITRAVRLTLFHMNFCPALLMPAATEKIAPHPKVQSPGLRPELPGCCGKRHQSQHKGKHAATKFISFMIILYN